MLVQAGDSECRASVWVLLLYTAPTAWLVHSAHVHLPSSAPWRPWILSPMCPADILMAAGTLLIAWALQPLQGWAVSLSVWVAGLDTSSRQWEIVFLGK